MAAILPVLFGVALVGCSQTDAKLPVYWEAPEFTLLNQLGDTVETADLRGTPWVASFVFTNCTDVPADYPKNGGSPRHARRCRVTWHQGQAGFVHGRSCAGHA